MGHFQLFLDDENSVKFDVTIEGVQTGEITSKLVFETRNGFELSFDAHEASGSEVGFIVPPLKGIISEGSIPARLEVYVDDRRFIPLSVEVDLKKSVKVEAVVRTSRVQRSPTVKAVLNETPKSRPKKITSSPPKRAKKKTRVNLDALISEIERK